MRRLLLVVPFLVACPPTNIVDDLPFDAEPIGDATLEGSGFDATSSDAEAGLVFNGGGPFTCGDCTCDGTLHLCASGVEAGAPIDASDDGGEGGACPEQDAGSGCVDIPIDCLPKPTCECVAAHYQNCTCFIIANGNGILIGCPLP